MGLLGKKEEPATPADPPCIGCDDDADKPIAKQFASAHADWMDALKKVGAHGSQRGEAGYGEAEGAS